MKKKIIENKTQKFLAHKQRNKILVSKNVKHKFSHRLKRNKNCLCSLSFSDFFSRFVLWREIKCLYSFPSIQLNSIDQKYWIMELLKWAKIAIYSYLMNLESLLIRKNEQTNKIITTFKHTEVFIGICQNELVLRKLSIVT